MAERISLNTPVSGSLENSTEPDRYIIPNAEPGVYLFTGNAKISNPTIGRVTHDGRIGSLNEYSIYSSSKSNIAFDVDRTWIFDQSLETQGRGDYTFEVERFDVDYIGGLPVVWKYDDQTAFEFADYWNPGGFFQNTPGPKILHEDVGIATKLFLRAGETIGISTTATIDSNDVYLQGVTEPRSSLLNSEGVFLLREDDSVGGFNIAIRKTGIYNLVAQGDRIVTLPPVSGPGPTLVQGYRGGFDGEKAAHGRGDHRQAA